MKTLTLTDKQIQLLKQDLENFEFRTDIQYTYFQVRLNQGTITAYTSGKVVFNGPDSLEYYHKYDTSTPVQQVEMAGSDEVGTGDYFGPVIVAACYIQEVDYKWLQPLGIMDSKSMTDHKITELAPTLMERLTYSLLVLDNPTYNKVHETMNLNAIKAMLHHKAYDHLKEKLGFLPKLCVVDQFMDPTKYYQVLKDDYGITHLTFETKAEDKYLAVACASVIARYTFLKSIQSMSEHYAFDFPLGAGVKVDIAGQELVRLYPKLNLKKVAKVHFKNTNRILTENDVL